MKRYLAILVAWIRTYERTELLELIAVLIINWKHIQKLAESRAISGDKLYGQSTYKKSKKQIRDMQLEELADVVVYEGIYQCQSTGQNKKQ